MKCVDQAYAPIESVSYLKDGPLFLFRFIWSVIGQVQASKRQLHTLAQVIAKLLQAIDKEYRAGRLVKTGIFVPLNDLVKLLDEVKIFVQKQAAYGFLKLIFTTDERIARIEEYHRRIGSVINSFQVSSLLNIQHWQLMNDNARAEDQQILNDRLSDLEANQSRLMEALDVKQSSVMAMMVSLQRHLNQHSGGGRERQFLSHSLQYLSTSSGSQVQLEDWMITSLEVDFGPEIGSGGFGQVYKGSWNKMEVALKVLRSEGGIIPSSKAIRREIMTWSKMRHPHILQFLGANVLDEKPFIVMPYLKNGNARDYTQDHPDCNRLKIIHHISLGVVYLHSQNIIHGDIKALNVLIDDNEKALLCDFGLSRVKADAKSRTSVIADAPAGVGSRNWMAPEQLMGGSLRKPCDIYAFGMTVYEIYTDEIPLGHINYTDFIELVVHQDVRPERPDLDECPGLSEEIWKLVEQCWVKEPTLRLNANAVCSSISSLLDMNVSLGATSPSPAASQVNLPSPPPKSPSLYIPPSSSDPTLPQYTASANRLPDNFAMQTWPQPDLSISPQQFSSSSPHPRSPFTYPLLPPGSPNAHIIDSKPIFKAKHTPKLETVNQGSLPPPLCVIKHNSPIQSIAYSPDGQLIASGCCDSAIRIWNVELGRYVARHFERHIKGVFSVAFSPRGRLIASGCGDNTVRIWDMMTGKRLAGPFEGHTKCVLSVAFSPNEHWVASGSWDGTIRIWDVKTGKCVSGPFQGHTNIVYSVAFSPDGKQVASCSADNTIRVWDAKTGEAKSAPFEGHTDYVRSVVFSPNGQWIASVSDDETARVWNAKTGKCVCGPLKGHTDLVTSVTFSPDGKRIASGSIDKTVRIWDIKTGECVSGPFQGHTGWIWSVAFSPDGHSVASGSTDKTIRIWLSK